MKNTQLAFIAAAAVLVGVTAQSSPSPSPLGPARFASDSIMVLRGGNGVNAPSTNAQSATLVEYGPDGTVRSFIPLPTTTNVSGVRCAVPYVSSVVAELYIQRSFDANYLVFGCNDYAIGSSIPANVSLRVVGLLRSDGALQFQQVTTMYRDASSTGKSPFRTVASFDGVSGVYTTGDTTNVASIGTQYIPYGATQSTRVYLGQAANQRYISVGPSWPGSGRPASEPQLYLSVRDPLGQRGVYAIGTGLPTTNQSAATLLPGFSALNTATNNFTTPLVNSFVFEPDGRTLWTSDTQAWGTNSPAAPAQYNIVGYAWDDASARYVRSYAGTVDASTQVQAIHGRYETGATDGVSRWVLYTVHSTKLFRIVPSLNTVTVIATPPTNTYFVSSGFAPFNVNAPGASAAPTPSGTPTATGSPSTTRSSTGTPTSSPSVSASPSATGTATLSPGAVPSASRSAAPSRTPMTARFAAENLLLLRGGAPGGTLSSVAQPLTLVELTPSGDVVGTIPLPTVTDAVAGTYRCSLGYSSNYQSEGFLQRTFDGTAVVFGCNDAATGTANPNNISTRVINVVRVDGSVTQFPVRSAYRDSTSSTLFRTVTSADGSGFWTTGTTSSGASNGLHYVPFGSEASERVSFINAGNQRFVHVGPSWPSSGRPASEPQLYVSLRDPLGQRGVHSVGTGLPVANVTDGTALLPGFADVNAVATSINLPLINSFCFEPDGRTLWTSDTMGWGTVTPAVTGFERLNIVQYVWSDATQGYARGLALPVDSSNALNFTGQQVQLVHGRYEGGVWTLYTVNNAKLFRVVPSTGTVTLIATAPAGTFFYGSAFRNFTNSPTATVSTGVHASITSSASPTATATSSPSSSPSSSRSLTSSASGSRTPSPSPSTQFAAFGSTSLLVLRVGDGGSATLTAGRATPVWFDEVSPTGALLSSVPAPRAYSAARGAARGACTLSTGSSLSGAWKHATEGLPALSEDGRRVALLCANVTNGTTFSVGLQRTGALLDAAGAWDTVTSFSAWSSQNGTNEYSGRMCAYGPAGSAPPAGTFTCVGQSRSFAGWRTFTYGSVGTGTAVQNAFGTPGFFEGRTVSLFGGALYGSNGPADEGWSGPVRIPGGGVQASLLPGFDGSSISPWTLAWESPTSLWIAVDHDLNATNVHHYELTAGVWSLESGAHPIAPGQAIYSIAGRNEAGTFVIYGTTVTGLYRYVPGSGSALIASAPANTAFRGVVPAPFDASMSARSATSTPTGTRTPTGSASGTATPTVFPTTSVTATPSSTASVTLGASLTPSGSASVSGTPQPSGTSTVSGTRTPTPSPSGVFQAFNPSSLVVLRVGDGSAALTAGVSRPVFVDEFLQTGGPMGTLLVNSVPAPRAYSAARGASRGACTLSTGTTASGTWRHDRDGLSSLSTDGKKLVVLCANATNGTALAVGVQRTIATLDASGAWDTVTGTTAFSNQNTTQATNEHGGRMCGLKSETGTFFCVGVSRSYNGFRSYAPGSFGNGVALLNGWGGAGNLDGRAVSISPFTGAVLGANGPADAGWAGVLTLPVANQTTALLPGFTGSGISPWTVAWESASALWVADDSAVGSWNVLRYTANAAGTWALESSHSLAPGVAIASIAGRWEAGVFVIYATTNSQLIRYTPAEGATVLATAPANTVFRGVAPAPYDSTLSPATPSASPTSGLSPSATRSGAPSVTATPPGTPPGTGTATVTRSGTGSVSGSSTGTGTATPTRTPTPSQTGTGSGSATGTGSRTGTPTPTVSRTQTGTPTSSGTSSVSATASETASVSSSQTGTPSASATETGTASSSQTGTGTGSPSPSQTGTAAETQTPSVSSTGTAASTATGTPTSAGTGTPTSTGRGTLAESGTATKTRVPLPSGSPTRTKTRTPTASRTKTKTKTKTRTPSKKKKLMA